MKYAVALVVVMFAVSAHGADDAAKGSATLGGKKMRFAEAGFAEGVKATVALLESCCSRSEGTAAELKNAQTGDHVRLVFTKPVSVTVLGERLDVSELVFTQPLNTGVFWLRTGDKVARCSKYGYEKQKDFVAWRDQARAAE